MAKVLHEPSGKDRFFSDRKPNFCKYLTDALNQFRALNGWNYGPARITAKSVKIFNIWRKSQNTYYSVNRSYWSLKAPGWNKGRIITDESQNVKTPSVEISEPTAGRPPAALTL
jgi:hypothetical protein